MYSTQTVVSTTERAFTTQTTSFSLQAGPLFYPGLALLVSGVIVGGIIFSRRPRAAAEGDTHVHATVELATTVAPAASSTGVLHGQTQGERYVEYLRKLDELRTRGEVSEPTYLRLKDSYRTKLGVPRAVLGTERPAEKFCLNCGVSLPVHATFCNRCGMKQ